MRRYKVLILLFVFTIVSLSTCPNNCNNHGTCTAGGVCECSEASGVGESGLMYVGADCSDRSCPSGFSYGSLPQPVSVNPHVGNSGTSRELSGGAAEVNLTRSLESEVVGDIISAPCDCKIESVDNNIGMFKCYDELNGNIGSMKLYGRNKESGEYYISKNFDDNDIPMDSVMCKLELEFSDLSIYHDSIIESDCTTAGSCNIKWIGMSEIMKNSSLVLENGDYNFLCGDNTVAFTKEEEDKDIIFTNKVDVADGIKKGTKCILLAKIDKDGTITNIANVDVNKCIYNTLPKLGEQIVIDKSTVFYKINNHGITLPSGSNYVLLECYNRYTDNYLGKAYLYHQTDDFIRFEFAREDDDISDYRFELIESYNDISLIYTSKVDSECVAKAGEIEQKAPCSIKWPNMVRILGTSEGSSLSFACINSTNYITKYESWNAVAGTKEGETNNIEFTIDKSTESVPNKDDKCVLLASVKDDSTKKLTAVENGISSFELKNVIEIGNTDKMYVNESTTIQFKQFKDNIYYAENINYMIGNVGSILLCNKGNVENELILIKKEVKETKEEENKVINKKSVIYVHDRNNKILSGSYNCKVIKLLNDHSLINPITVTDECKTDSCTLKWKSMSYFVQDIFQANKDVILACENKTGLITEYTFSVNAIPSIAAGESTSDVEFTLKDSDNIPLVGDICHYIGTDPDNLKSSDYSKELNTYILISKEFQIAITKREMQSNVYEVVNYEIHNSKSYVGKLYCQNVNGKNGNAYLMGKGEDNNFYILYDLDIVNINDYICILTEIYNDMSLFNSVKVLGQGNGENGICYDKKCDIKWTGMNQLLEKVNLAEGKKGVDYISGITDPTYMVCSDRKNNINIYKYKYNKPTVQEKDNDIIFTLEGDKYPSVGDKCNSLTNFEGTNIDTTLNSLLFINSDYGKTIKDNILTQIYLMEIPFTDKTIYKVKGIKLDDDSFEIGILKCKNNGISVGYATVYKRENDIFYIKYNFLGETTPLPSNYTYSIIEKYNDLSLLFTTNVPTDCKPEDKASSCSLSIDNSYDIIKKLYNKNDDIVADGSMNFLCFESKEMKIFKYTTQSHDDNTLKFIIDTTNDSKIPLADTKCYMASKTDFTPIDNIESKDNAFIGLLKSTVDSIKIYEVVNMDKLIETGIGSLKCYNKYSNEYIGIGRMWGKEKSNPTISYISFENDEGNIDNPTPEIYNCKVDKTYSDYSIYPPITTPEQSCKFPQCELTWSGMEPIIKGIKINTEDLSFKCIKDIDTQVVHLTTTKPADPAVRQRLLTDNDLLLYLKSSQDGVDLNGYKCYMNVKSDGTNIAENEESELDKSTKILSIKTSLDTNVNVYEVSNIEFPGEKGIGSQKCKINGVKEYKTVYFMGKNDKNYFVRFEDDTMKVGNILTIECINPSYLSDLSNYYPLNIDDSNPCTVSGCTLTWTGIKPLLSDFAISDTQPDTNLKIWCVSDNKIVKVESGITASITDGKNIQFSFKPDTEIAAASECHLIANFDGSIIEDGLKSDFGKTLNGEDGKIPYIDGDEIELDNNRKLYKVKNVKYDNVTTNIGELKCTNTETSKILGTAYVMGYHKTDYYYLIDYSFTTEKPTPEKYKCEVQKVYKDLSLLFDIYAPSTCKLTSETTRRSLTTTATCSIEVKGLDEVFTRLDIKATETNLVCYNGVSNKYKIYKFDITVPPTTSKVTLTIDSSSTSVPADHDKCQMLLTHTGDGVDLSKSDFGIKNNIKIDNPDENTEIKVNDNSPKVTSKEEASIPDEMPVTGGIIKCYDKISGEYYGTANVLGSDSDGKTIIIYNFEVPNGIEHDPSDYISEISSTRNDFSETNPAKVEESICSDKIGYCKLLWKNMYSILGSKLLKNRIRLLADNNNNNNNNNNIPVSCANNKNGLLTEYSGVAIGNSDDDLEISLDKSNNKFPAANDICHVLVDSEGKGKDITKSDLMKSIKTNPNGDMILLTAIVPDIDKDKISTIAEGGSNSKGNMEYYVYVNPEKDTANKDKLLGDMKNFGVFVMNKPEGQYAKNILSHLVVGNHIEIASDQSADLLTSPTEQDCIITSIDKNYEYQTSSPRLLNEERELSVGDSSGNLIGITVNANGNSYKLPSGHEYVKILFKDCDNSNPDLFCAHEYVECSGVGTCDRESGECKCYNGFSGSACERMDCPNNCNNHGRCIKVSDKLLNNEYPSIFGSISGSEMIFGCLCDSGYRGADCSLKECPSEAKADGKKDRDCSSNGLCDYSDGSCKCFDGYYGDACQFSIGNA